MSVLSVKWDGSRQVAPLSIGGNGVDWHRATIHPRSADNKLVNQDDDRGVGGGMWGVGGLVYFMMVIFLLTFRYTFINRVNDHYYYGIMPS